MPRRYRVVLENLTTKPEFQTESTHQVYLWDEYLTEGAILYQNGTSRTQVFSFEMPLQNSTLRYTHTSSALDIATTTDRLWLTGSSYFQEFYMTLAPFSLTYNRIISHVNLSGFNVGACAVDNNTIIGVINTNVVSVDISGAIPIVTPLFSIGAGRKLTGDIIYNSALDRYIATHQLIAGGDYRITEYSSSGTVLYDRPVTANRFGLFVDNGHLYAGGYSTLHEITATTDVYLGAPFTTWMYGASQLPAYTNFSFVG